MEDKLNKIIYLLEELLEIEKSKVKKVEIKKDNPELKEYYSLKELESLLGKLNKSTLSDKQLEFIKNIHNFGLQYNRVTSKQYQSIVNLL